MSIKGIKSVQEPVGEIPQKDPEVSFTSLPVEMYAKIASYLPSKDLVEFKLVSKKCGALIDDRFFWQSRLVEILGNPYVKLSKVLQALSKASAGSQQCIPKETLDRAVQSLTRNWEKQYHALMIPNGISIFRPKVLAELVKYGADVSKSLRGMAVVSAIHNSGFEDTCLDTISVLLGSGNISEDYLADALRLIMWRNQDDLPNQFQLDILKELLKYENISEGAWLEAAQRATSLALGHDDSRFLETLLDHKNRSRSDCIGSLVVAIAEGMPSSGGETRLALIRFLLNYDAPISDWYRGEAVVATTKQRFREVQHLELLNILLESGNISSEHRVHALTETIINHDHDLRSALLRGNNYEEEYQRALQDAEQIRLVRLAEVDRVSTYQPKYFDERRLKSALQAAIKGNTEVLRARLGNNRDTAQERRGLVVIEAVKQGALDALHNLLDTGDISELHHQQALLEAKEQGRDDLYNALSKGMNSKHEIQDREPAFTSLGSYCVIL